MARTAPTTDDRARSPPRPAPTLTRRRSETTRPAPTRYDSTNAMDKKSDLEKDFDEDDEQQREHRREADMKKERRYQGARDNTGPDDRPRRLSPGRG